MSNRRRVRDREGIEAEYRWYVPELLAGDRLGAVVFGNPRVVRVRGSSRDAGEFNGTSDGIVMRTTWPIAHPTFFVQAEVLVLPGGTSEQRFVHVQEEGSNNRALLELRLSGRTAWYVDTILVSDGRACILQDNTRTHRVNAWHTVRLEYDGECLRHLVDGDVECEGIMPRAHAPGPGFVSLGMRGNRESHLRGRLREVVVGFNDGSEGRSSSG